MISLIVCIIGLLLYLILPSGLDPRSIEIKFEQIGFQMFWVGLLAYLLQGAPHLSNLIK